MMRCRLNEAGRISFLWQVLAFPFVREDKGMRRSIMMAIVLIVSCPALHAQVVLFVDAELKAAVESKLGVLNPTVTDMKGLTELAVAESNISDLTGLETAVNLAHLNLTNAQVSDLSPLSDLTNLRSLWMDGNPISDLSPLDGLTNLTFLQLYGTSISDLSPLAGLTNLSRLYLGSYQISDLLPLSGLTQLTKLAVYGGQVSDISPLSGLTALAGLWLNYNQITDVGPLSGLINLRTLDLFQNQISDIAPLAGLTGLVQLDLRNNPLNQEACDVYIPQIEANETTVNYDPCVTVMIPDVTDLSQLVAKEILQTEGFTVRIVTAPSKGVPIGHVISQNPPAGTIAAVGSDVTLTISTGPDDSGSELPPAVSHWMLDEAEGLIAADSVGGHDGSLMGDPVWLPHGGILGGALWFDGIDDYVYCGTFDPSKATGKLTVCLWARWNGLTGWYQVLIAKRDEWASGQMMWQLEAAPDDGMVGFFSTSGGYRHAFSLPVGQWVHIAASCDGGTMMFYRDGGRSSRAR